MLLYGCTMYMCTYVVWQPYLDSHGVAWFSMAAMGAIYCTYGLATVDTTVQLMHDYYGGLGQLWLLQLLWQHGEARSMEAFALKLQIVYVYNCSDM